MIYFLCPERTGVQYKPTFENAFLMFCIHRFPSNTGLGKVRIKPGCIQPTQGQGQCLHCLQFRQLLCGTIELVCSNSKVITEKNVSGSKLFTGTNMYCRPRAGVLTGPYLR